MSSEDDDELAEMRAQLKARTGTESLSTLRQRLAPQQQDLEEPDEDDQPNISETVVELPHSGVPGPIATVSLQDEEFVGPAVPPPDSDGDDGDAWDDRGTGELDEESDPYRLPVSSEVALEGQGKVVASLDVDHSGSRVLAGSRDYTIRLFDFNGMKSDLRSFRQLEPFEGHPVHAVSWSPTGDAFLAVTGSAKIKVYDRDGVERGESVQGDMYIRDQRNTKGHVSPCTYGHWHPKDKYTALTSSEDGTVRVWDTWNVMQKTVIKPSLPKPGRVAVSTARFSSEGRLIVAGLNNGTIQVWDVKGKFGTSAAVGQVLPPKPQMLGKQDWRYVSGGGQVCHGAHDADSEVTSFAFSRDDNTLLSRGADETLKVWDLRKFKMPVHVWDGLPTMHATTQVAFSPDERLILTGVSAGRDGQGGGLLFFDRSSKELVRRIAMPASVVAVQWHPKLNQILLGVGDKQAGSVRILYDHTWSTRGVLLCAGRKPRAQDPFDFQAPLVIHNPHALPMFREVKPTGKRKREKDRMDPIKSHAPERGSAAALKPGTGGKIGATGGTLLTQYVLKHQGMLKNPAEEDIRASILRHAGKEDQFNQFTKAYEKTQPHRIFAEEEESEKEEE